MSHNVKSNREYWENFYKRNNLSVPSQFCAMVATEIDRGSCIVDLGCGNGRDSLYFASQRHSVRAIDLSHEAVKACSQLASEMGMEHAEFRQGDLSAFADLEGLFEAARSSNKDGRVIGYSRFVMHSINDTQQSEFLANIAKLIHSGERIYFEFRSKEDANLDKTFGGHYRRFVDTEVFIQEMTDQHGFTLKYALTGQGMAKYKSEDPFVSRLIFEMP